MRPKRCLAWIVAGTILLGEISAWGQETAQEIAAVEKLSRSKRTAAYESLANRKGLSDKDRLAVIAAFAKHAKDLSPHYGDKASLDAGRWRSMLEWGHERDPRNRDMTVALLQLLLNDAQYRAASPVAQAFAKSAPEDHVAQAWSEWCNLKLSSKPDASPMRKFPLHFCVLTRNPKAAAAATREQCLKETQIFNDNFRTLSKAPLVTFVFKGHSRYSDIRTSKSSLVELGDNEAEYDSSRYLKAFNACDDPRVRDPKAINVYIFDSYSKGAGFDDKTSHGVRNSNRPYLLIDWQRLGSNIQNAEPHEMGHAFGLEHVGVIDARAGTSTNIMTSAAEGFGSGGKRDLGFTESQAALILHHAERTAGRLGLPKE